MDIVKYIPINWGLIKHPVNWLTILMMLIIMGIAFEQVYKYLNPGVIDNA